ncbi:MAG: hypothetical protein WC563_15585 [Brevundimonas sp.]
MTQAIVTFNSTLPITYDVTEEQIELKRATYAAIDLAAPGGYEACRLAIADCRETMVAIEERRKELKAPALQWGTDVDSEAKRLSGMVAEIRTPLQEKKAVVDAAKAKIKRDKEEAEKAALEAQIEAERAAKAALVKAAQDAENARLAAVAEANRIESARLAAERKALDEQMAAQRKEADRIAAEQEAARKAEIDRVAAERAKLEADRVAEENRQRVAREQEDARLAAVRKEEEDRAAQARAEIEAERQALETAKAAEQARKDAAAQAERERIAAEEATVKEAERKAAFAARLEALRPDGEKLRAWADQLSHIPPPAVTSAEAKAAIVRAGLAMDALVEMIRCFDRPEQADISKGAPRLVIAVEDSDRDDSSARIVGTLNGKELFSGHYGGEPEDNSRGRDYDWVETAIERVAKAGGIAVEYTVLKDDEDDEAAE